MSGIVLSTLYAQSHFVSFILFIYFISFEIETIIIPITKRRQPSTEKLSNLPEVKQLVRARAWIGTHLPFIHVNSFIWIM